MYIYSPVGPGDRGFPAATSTDSGKVKDSAEIVKAILRPFRYAAISATFANT